jgi:hypothetical protein
VLFKKKPWTIMLLIIKIMLLEQTPLDTSYARDFAQVRAFPTISKGTF